MNRIKQADVATLQADLGFALRFDGKDWLVIEDGADDRCATITEQVLWQALTKPDYLAEPVAPAEPATNWRGEVGAMARTLDGCATSAPADSHPDTMRQVASRLFRLLTNAAPVAPAEPIGRWCAQCQDHVTRCGDPAACALAWPLTTAAAPAEPTHLRRADGTLSGMFIDKKVKPAPDEWSDARLRGIASDYFPDAAHWPAAMLCLRHLLMEQSTSNTNVRRILLDVVPGPDGMGFEVYAESNADVERKLGEMGDRIEELEMRLATPATPPDTRKPCTCDGAGRGPGRECVVQAGGRLGELWRCAKGVEPAQATPEEKLHDAVMGMIDAACDALTKDSSGDKP